MEDKIYEYDGKYYSETDYNKEGKISDDLWGGDLYDLYCELEKKRLVDEYTVYYKQSNPEETYEEVEDLIAEEFDELEVELEDIEKEE